MPDDNDVIVELDEEDSLEEEGLESSEDSDEVASLQDEEEEEGRVPKRRKGAEKRISRLVKERNEALEHARALEQRYGELNNRYMEVTGEASRYIDLALDSEERALKQALDGLKNEIKDAQEEQDTDRVTDAQLKMADVASSLRDIQQRKQQKEDYVRRMQPYGQQQVQQQQMPQQVPSSKALDWKSRNPWFGKDEVMTTSALVIERQMVQNEGFQPDSNEYYQELDARLRRQFPNRVGGETAGNGKSRTPVAGVSRTSPSHNQQRVPLTRSEMDIAKRLGLSAEQYAREKLKMERVGEYGL